MPARKKTQRKKSPNRRRAGARFAFRWESALQVAVLIGAFLVIAKSALEQLRAKPGRQVYRIAAGPAVDEYLPHPPYAWDYRSRYYLNPAAQRLRFQFPRASGWIVHHRQDWGAPQIGRNIAGEALKVAGRTYAQGVGTHANSELLVHFDGEGRRFSGRCGLDAMADGGPVHFQILARERLLFDSGAMQPGEPAQPFSIELPPGDITLRAATAGAIASTAADWVDLHLD